MNDLTPQQALENLARVADVALLNAPDRRAINLSVEVLAKAIQPMPAPTPPVS